MKDRVVLVTGSSRGIGLAIAAAFARSGCRVVLNCLSNVQKMHEAIATLKKINSHVMGIQADVSKYESAASLINEAQAAFGSIDILINNAGISHIGLLQDMSPSDIDRVINTNLVSVINCCRLAVPGMLEKKDGCIINISSIWGQSGASCESVYSASKGGIDSFTKALAKELGPSGIRVNTISCGVIDTDMNTWLNEEEKARLTEQIPLNRIGTRAEVAQAALFLASPEASYVTGQILTVDGGFI